jgi:hypothetical protein
MMRKSSKLSGLAPEVINLPNESPNKRRRLDKSTTMRVESKELVNDSNICGILLF